MLEGFFGCPGVQYATLAANSQAVSFLVAERGDWAESRRHICGLLGIEDARFTAMCREVFEGGPVPQVPGFESRSKKDLDKQRELYRALQIEPLAPPVAPPKPKPKPVALLAPPDAERTAMAAAIFAAMEKLTSTPIEVNEDDLLYWPIKAPDTGTFQAKPLPAVGTKQYRIMRVATRLHGGNLQQFHAFGHDWEDLLRDVAARYQLEIVMFQDVLPVTEMTGETRLYLRLRP